MKTMKEETLEHGGADWARLARLRDRIDELDAAIVNAIVSRYRIAEEVGTLKGSSGIAPLDPAREAEIVRRAAAAARDAGVPEEGVRQIFWTLLDHCREGVRRTHAIEQVAPGPRVVLSG